MSVTRSQASTRGVQVDVVAKFSPERSDLPGSVWFFVYTVTIANTSDATVQLLNRHWEITDGNGRVEHVRGPGVVGEQPVLEPGRAFRYSSGCPLPTPFGFMRGEYDMIVTETGERFEANVELFSLRLEGDALH